MLAATAVLLAGVTAAGCGTTPTQASDVSPVAAGSPAGGSPAGGSPAGELDYLSGSGWTAPLGGSAPITAMSPINGPVVEASFGAGDYRLSIYPETTCSWTFELWPDN